MARTERVIRSTTHTYDMPCRLASLNGLARLVVFAVALGLAACSSPNDDAERPRDGRAGDCSCRKSDQDLETLRRFAELIDRSHYGESFPDDVPFRWADSPREFYAYTSFKDRTIYFVRPNFREDWPYNLKVVMHEMAHFAVGPAHDHDAVWKREFARLQRTATSAEFKHVRSRAARQPRRRR